MSAVGTQIAELWSSITNFQTELNSIEERHNLERAALNDKHRIELAEKNAEFNKAKASFASYLKQAGIDNLLSPIAVKDKGKQGKTEGKPRKPRKSSAEVLNKLSAARTVFKGASYVKYKGLDTKSGWPIRYQGRNPMNDELDAQMMADAKEAGYYIDIKAKELVKMDTTPTSQVPGAKKKGE